MGCRMLNIKYCSVYPDEKYFPLWWLCHINSKNARVKCLGKWFGGGPGAVRLITRLGDLRGVFQAQLFNDSYLELAHAPSQETEYKTCAFPSPACLCLSFSLSFQLKWLSLGELSRRNWLPVLLTRGWLLCSHLRARAATSVSPTFWGKPGR